MREALSRIKLGLIAGATALLFLYACEFGTAPGGGGTGGEGLTGILVDSRGTAVAGARVRIYPEFSVLAKGSSSVVAHEDSTLTKADGSFRFKGLSASRYNLIASFVRHDTTFALFLRGIEYAGGKMDLGRDTLRQAGTLLVGVKGDDQLPLAGALCEVVGTPWRTLSDALGSCRFDGAAAGDYVVQVSAAGRVTRRSDVTVQSGGTAGYQVTMFEAGRDPVPGDWMPISAQGYLFYVPTNLLVVSEGQGIDSYEATYKGPGITLRISSGLTQPLARPDTLPGYHIDTLLLDSGARAIYIAYRTPANVYQVGIQVERVYNGVTNRVVFSATGASSEDSATLALILRSAQVWKGQGPAPVALPPKPVLQLPAAAATEVSATPSFQWSTGMGNVVSTVLKSYRFQLSLDSAFSSFVANDSVPLSTGLLSHTLSAALALNTRFYWRVFSVGPAGSTVSDARSFTTAGSAVAAPTLVSPVNGEDSIAVSNAELFWEPVAGAVTSYRVQISGDSTFAENGMFEDTVVSASSTSWKVPYSFNIQGGGRSLGENRRYYWRVFAVTATSEHASATQWFTTTPWTPVARSLVSPANGAANVSVTPTLAWGALADGDFWRYFRVQVSTDSLFTALVVNDSVSNPVFSGSLFGYTLRVGPLEPATRYFWRVLAGGSAPEAVSTSQARSFTTVSAAGELPIVPQLDNPLNNVNVLADSQTFSWTYWNRGESTVYYQFQLASDSLFANLVTNDSVGPGINQTGLTLHKVAVGRERTYYWRVIGIGPGGSTPSETRRFTTYSPPAAVPLASPRSGDTGVALSPALLWSVYYSPNNIESFRIQVSEDSTFVSLAVDESRPAPAPVLNSLHGWTVGPLLSGRRYHWRVISEGKGGLSTASAVGNFRVEGGITPVLPPNPLP